MAKQRLDNLLVSLNLCPSRALAQRLIRAGEVRVNGELIDKPGTEIKDTAEITLKQKPPYVSRGGEKLIKAIETFAIDVRDRVCLDGGISTGGFTDCLLQQGAKQVYGVDVGYGQVAWKIRNDDRVTLLERTNFRYLTADVLYGQHGSGICSLAESSSSRQSLPANFGVMDLSFISLTKVLQPLWNLLAMPKEVVLLVKPQFEVGREKVGKKGVVRNSQDRALAILEVAKTAKYLGWQYRGLVQSPLKGPAGNIEFLLWLEGKGSSQSIDLAEIQKIIDA